MSKEKQKNCQDAHDRSADKMRFVFMDESGKRESDRFFVCGFLEIEDVVSFCRNISRLHNQIKNASINNMHKRVDILREGG